MFSGTLEIGDVEYDVVGVFWAPGAVSASPGPHGNMKASIHDVSITTLEDSDSALLFQYLVNNTTFDTSTLDLTNNGALYRSYEFAKVSVMSVVAGNSDGKPLVTVGLNFDSVTQSAS